MSNQNDADFHAGPMNARIVASPWHTSLQYDGSGDSPAHERMVAIPDYDPIDPEQDGYFVRVDSLQVNEDGEASATSILWDVRELARFCKSTLAALGADHAIERAALAESIDANEDADEEDEYDEGEGDDDDEEEEDPEEDEEEEDPEEDEEEEDPEEDEEDEDPEGDEEDEDPEGDDDPEAD